MAGEITMAPSISSTESLLGILQQMQALSQQPVLPDNPLAQAGAVLQGFSAGTQGRPNPAVDFWLKQRQLQMQGLGQQATTGAALSSIENAKAQRQEALDRMFLDVNQGLLKSDNPQARLLGASGLLEFGNQRFNIQAPPDLAGRLAAKMLSPDEDKRIMGDLLAGIDPVQIQEAVPNFRLSDLPYYKQLVANDDALKSRGFTPRADLAEAARKRLAAQHDEQLSALGLSGTGRIAEDARNYIQTTFRKQPWQATANEAQKAIDSVTAKRAEHVKFNERMSEQRLELMNKALDLATGRASILGYKTVIQPLQKQSATLHSLAMLDSLVEKMPNLPAHGATLAGVAAKQWQRAWANPTDENLLAFKQLWGPIMIGQIDRSTFDEKGVRAMQAFQQQFDMLNRVPSARSLHRLFEILRESVQTSMRMTGTAAEQLKLTPEVQSIVGQIVGSMGTTTTASELDKDY